MGEGSEKDPPIDNAWRERGSKEEPYRARRLLHEAETSIEYGEKTWTTAQTVRDLMQNHLDAETEQYYLHIAEIIFGKVGLKQYFDSKSDADERKGAEDLLHAASSYAKYAKDMSPKTRLQSEEYLQKLAKGLSVDSEVRYGNTFFPPLFLEAAKTVEERRPLVSYEVMDTESNTSIGWVAYETLRDEELYQSTKEDGFRYEITGMKIVDHGFGFDSQLSALYMSSKTDKKHLRGKFGEGVKMSELHILRNGASMKMRSRYTLESDEEHGKSRAWQARPMVQEGRLVSRGVEVEQESEEDTGSLISVSLQGAKEAFRKEFIENVDPRLKGLEGNIADFGDHGFSYPMPISESPLSGVDTSGSGLVHYVQGLRVDLAEDSFGYTKPWFSYNFLDSSVIAGRDRSELSEEIIEKIRTFWEHADTPELLEELVRTAVHDKERGKETMFSSSEELKVLSSILIGAADSDSWPSARIQEIVDTALLKELELEEAVDTLVVSRDEMHMRPYADAMRYARERGYVIKPTASVVGPHAITRFAERLPDSYRISSLSDIRNKIWSESKKNEVEVVEHEETEREKAIREVFDAAVASLNELVRAAGYAPKSFQLKFDRPDIVNVGLGRDSFRDRGYDDEVRGFSSRQSEPSPIVLNYDLDGNCLVWLSPYEVHDPENPDPRVLQRQIEIHLLSSFGPAAGIGHGEWDNLKGSQQVLDKIIATLIPEDAPLLDVVPKHLDYAKDPDVLSRLIEVFLDNAEQQDEKGKLMYQMYLKSLDPHLTLEEAQKMHKEGIEQRDIEDIIESRVFLLDKTLNYFDDEKVSWEKQRLGGEPAAVWQGLPVFALDDGRYFVQAPMEKGAVLAKGEGKNREYLFSEGDDYLHIGLNDVGYVEYGHAGNVEPHLDGIIIRGGRSGSNAREEGAQEEQIYQLLEGYVYYPAGIVEREESIEEGLSSTAIPIEYGRDEWDNPIRVFQDVIQNHVDASEEGERVQLMYEVDRKEGRVFISEEELAPLDKITGLKILDAGSGYYPNEIAIMGASSKRSPLFAGKYGEGQKMIAAAALRNNLELEYGSTVSTDSGRQSWSARAVKEPRLVVIDRKEVEKHLVAFDVVPIAPQGNEGSTTTLRLPEQATEEQEKLWVEWAAIVDPRQKDASGHGGLARYVRQLRDAGSERIHTVGSVSVLLDEPGAVYENGLRINPQAETGRSLSFGYDVPEVVTTRERNSYNSNRLEHYMRHAISNISDPLVAEEILLEYERSEAGPRTPDLDIGQIMHQRHNNAVSIWAEVAKKVWPGYLVYSSEKIEGAIYGPTHTVGEREDRNVQAGREKARQIRANMVHLDKNKILDVPKQSYSGFSRLLPTAKSVIDRMKTEVLPITPAIKNVLSEVVAESAKVIIDMLTDAQESLSEAQRRRSPGSTDSTDRLEIWDDAATIRGRNAVAIAPISAGFHGKVDSGITFNEALLLKGNARELAETALHEVAHIASGYGDYGENFVTTMYELAQHLAKNKARGRGKPAVLIGSK